MLIRSIKKIYIFYFCSVSAILWLTIFKRKWL